jgi:hypothetical protein
MTYTQMTFGAMEGADLGGVPQNPNPLVRCYGLGPEGEKCATCAEMLSLEIGVRVTPDGLDATPVYAPWCQRTVPPTSKGKAHRLKWQACAKYRERPGLTLFFVTMPSVLEGGSYVLAESAGAAKSILCMTINDSNLAVVPFTAMRAKTIRKWVVGTRGIQQGWKGDAHE